MKKIIALLTSALCLSAFGTSALAQDENGTGLTCADIEFHADVKARAADIDQACRDVVELNGARYAKTMVKLDDVRGNRAKFRFIYPDGSSGSRHSVQVDSNWRATIQGREYRMSQLARGQELSVYLPADRWEAHFGAPSATFVTYAPAAIAAADYDDDMGSGAMLPATASPLPLFGLCGGLMLFGASLIRIFRRS